MTVVAPTPDHQAAEVVVAGHVCVDVIPTFGDEPSPLEQILIPGGLTTVGPVVASTGGAVSNTGLALHKLGARVSLMGKVGGDLFGQAAIDLLRERDPRLIEDLILAPDEPSSYTIVINLPGVDRIFLHCPGPNNTYGAADIPLEKVATVRLFHFGYPPIMRRMYINEGAELAELFRSVKALGVTTSLDMCQPDPSTEAGRAPWPTILRNVLPHVYLFLPSMDEIVYMLDREAWNEVRDGKRAFDGPLMSRIADELLAMGAAVVVLKLGDRGLYVRTTPDVERLRILGRAAPADPAAWAGRELLTPCFRVKVGGTTGAGDSTIAGFLMGLLRGHSLEETLTLAVAVGACSVESPDASGSIPRLDVVEERIASGWGKHTMELALPDWTELNVGLWRGPNDGGQGTPA